MTTNKRALLTIFVVAIAATAAGVALFVASARSPEESIGADPAITPSVARSTPPERPVQLPATSAGASPTKSANDSDPKSTVVALVDARFKNDEVSARRHGSETAVRQIFSFPPFNPHEALIACGAEDSKATCTLSAPAAGGSMILSLEKVDDSWKVSLIEPVID